MQKINKKGTTLKSITMITIFGILIATAFMFWIFDGVISYDTEVSSEFASSMDTLNSTLNNMSLTSLEFESDINKISETPATAIFFIPKAIIDALKTTFSFVKTFWIILTEFTKMLGIPPWVFIGLEAAFIFLIAYLIMEAYMRYKGI